MWILLMHILTACLLLAPSSAATPNPPIYINGQECPANVVTLSSPADLIDNLAANTTYILNGTSYTIRDYIAPTDDFCYLAEEGVGPVTITLLNVNGAGFQVVAGLLGLKGVTLTDSGSSAEVVVTGGVLAAEDVAVQGFSAGVISAGVRLDGGHVLLSKTVLSANSISGPGTTAFDCVRGSAELYEVTFQGNTAGGPGAALAIGNCTVTLSGLTTFIDNSATDLFGGALYVDGGSLIVNGPVCAQGNTALRDGNFLSVFGGSVVLNNTVNINGNTSTAGDIYIFSNSTGSVSCGLSGSNWVGGTGYTIVGDACTCNQQFVDGNSTTCNSCGALGWNETGCECAREAPPPPEVQCRSGRCCNAAEQTYLAAGTLCRRPQGSCEVESFCSGNSSDCPRRTAPDGQSCAYTRENDHFFWPVGGQLSEPDTDKSYEASFNADQATESMPANTDNSNDYYRHPHYDRPPHYPHSDPWEHEEDESRFYDWPDCWARCQSGTCMLDRSYPGCCFLSTFYNNQHDYGSWHGSDNGYGYGHDRYRYGAGGSGSYMRGVGRGKRICWPGQEGGQQ